MSSTAQSDVLFLGNVRLLEALKRSLRRRSTRREPDQPTALCELERRIDLESRYWDAVT